MLTRSAVSVVEALAEDIGQRIFAGELEGGTPLTEQQLADHYAVARPTAKAAIEKLVAGGLLSRGVNKTARVPLLTAEDIHEIYHTRILLETAAVRTLALAGEVPFEAREANLRLQAFDQRFVAEIIEADIQFHTSLIDSLQNSRYSALYRSIWSEIRMCMAQVQGFSLLSTEAIAKEHARILELIESRLAEEAAAEVEGHLIRAGNRLVEFQSGGAPRSTLAL